MPASPDLSFERLIESGRRAYEAGNLSDAIAAYQSALSTHPNDVKILFLLGNILTEAGQIAAAIAHLQHALAIQRNHPAIAASLGQAYFAAQRFSDAENEFRKAMRLDPREAQSQLGLANSLAMQGKLDSAKVLLRKLVERHPRLAYAWLNLGNVARDQQHPEDAIAAYRKALDIDPAFVDARNNLGGVLHSTLRLDDAEREYRACIAHAPSTIAARCNLASVLIDAGRFSEAEEISRAVIEMDAHCAEGYSMLGASIGFQGRLRDALRWNQKALELSPQSARLASAHGAALLELGEIREGLSWVAKAWALEPDALLLHQLLGPVLLAQGLFRDGWTDYRYRPAYFVFRDKLPDVALSQTLPDDLRGKHVCVLREQGLGDELFFLRYVPALAATGAQITYRSGEKIKSLVERLPNIGAVIDAQAAPPAADITMLAGDLPGALSLLTKDGLADASYLDESVPHPELGSLLGRLSLCCTPVAPSVRIAPADEVLRATRLRLRALGPPPYLGITWRGGIPPHEQRSTALMLFKEIAKDSLGAALRQFPGTLLALQRAPMDGEIDAMSRALGRPLHDLSALNDDLESMLALLALIDEYVGVSNTNMHLRACAGRTARVLVPSPAEWRWMACGKSSPWFPGFSIYRQSCDGDWRPALDGLTQDIERKYPAA